MKIKLFYFKVFLIPNKTIKLKLQANLNYFLLLKLNLSNFQPFYDYLAIYKFCQELNCIQKLFLNIFQICFHKKLQHFNIIQEQFNIILI